MYFLCIWAVGEDQRCLNCFLLTGDPKLDQKVFQKRGSRGKSPNLRLFLQLGWKKWLYFDHFCIDFSIEFLVLRDPCFFQLFRWTFESSVKRNQFKYLWSSPTVQIHKKYTDYKKIMSQMKTIWKIQFSPKNCVPKPRICTVRGFTRLPPHIQWLL